MVRWKRDKLFAVDLHLFNSSSRRCIGKAFQQHCWDGSCHKADKLAGKVWLRSPYTVMLMQTKLHKCTHLKLNTKQAHILTTKLHNTPTNYKYMLMHTVSYRFWYFRPKVGQTILLFFHLLVGTLVHFKPTHSSGCLSLVLQLTWSTLEAVFAELLTTVFNPAHLGTKDFKKRCDI